MPTRCGKRSSVARINSGVLAEPPMATDVRCSGGRSSVPGSASSRKMWVAVPFQAVMPSSTVSCSTRVGSKRPIGHTVLTPPSSDVTVELCIPERWNSGNTARRAPPAAGAAPESIESRAPMRKAASTNEMKLRWLSMAAFGRPVVPDVNCSTIGSSSAIGVSGRPTPGWAAAISAKSSSMTMVGTPGSSPSRRARRRRSATSRAGRVDSRPYSISLRVHQPLKQTATAPSAAHAQKVTMYSGQLAARIATRSPWPMPRSARAAATAAACSVVSANVSTRRSPASSKTQYSASPFSTAPASRSRSDRGRFTKTCMGSPSTSSVASSKKPPGAVSAAVACS